MSVREELVSAVTYALRIECRAWLKWKHTDDNSARIVAEKFADHIERTRFVVERRPPPIIVPARGSSSGEA